MLRILSETIPEEYREKFEEERLEQNIMRMRWFTFFMVIVQILLQMINIGIPKRPGEGLVISDTYYIALSMLTIIFGLGYWVLLTKAYKDKTMSRKLKQFLVQSLLYIYVGIRVAYHTLNILSIQGVTGYIMLILIIALIPILSPTQSIISIMAIFVYTLILTYFTQWIVSPAGATSFSDLIYTDMRANLIIITGIVIIISVLIYRMYVSNFVKSEALAESKIFLEETIRSRTEQLQHKTISTEIAALARNRFLASMSQEVRAPLNEIIGLTHAAKKTADKEEIDCYLSEIATSARHLSELQNEILDIANIDFERLKIEKKGVALKRLMKSVVGVFSERFESKKIRFENNIDSFGEIIVMCDSLRLQQVLFNMLSNAARFTPRGGTVELLISVIREKPGSINIMFKVADNGIGIAKKHQEKLFGNTIEDSERILADKEGAGIGLPVSQRLVNMMGGLIELESEIGKGSTFSFSLTFDKISLNAGTENLTVPNLSGKNILVTDDMEIDRMVICEMLGDTNAGIDIANDGLEAVERFTKSPEGHYSLIIMDLLMPNMDGHTAAREIRSLKRSDAATTPIIAVSANVYAEDVAETLRSGMNKHIAKPVDFVELMQSIIEHSK